MLLGSALIKEIYQVQAAEDLDIKKPHENDSERFNIIKSNSES